jgi:zinc/manganese transport system substrate-binding protein
LTVCVLLAGAADAAAKLRVVATLSDLADLTRQVGGDRVEVTAICPGYQDAHYLEPKPSYARTLRRADLLVYSGLELEVGWLPPLLDTARNPKLRPGSRGLLEAALSLDQVLEVPQGSLDRSHGDVHPFGNPHILMDPRNGLRIARGIADRLSELDPDGTEAYRHGYEVYRQHLETRIAEWEERAAGLRGVAVACYHNQWLYLTGWLGLEIVGYVENRPGIQPSPRHVEELIATLEARQVPLVICATYADVDATREVARRAGAQAVVLPAGVDGVEEATSYEALIEVIVSRLLAAMSKGK